jgi:membrane protein DedA with SNARE-associated domain
VGESLDFLIRHGSTVLFLVVLGEQLGLPLVGAPVLLAAGALGAMGRLAASNALLLTVLACLLADLAWYEVGRRRGASVLTWLCRIALEPDSCVRRTENVFARYGARALLVAKFVPGLNSIAAPLAGVVGMGATRFLAWDTGGALLWGGTYIGLTPNPS